MALSNKEIIPATTSATTSAKFNVGGTQSVVCGILIGEEKVVVEVTHNGNDWKPLVLNGVTQQVDASHAIITINGPGSYRCVKSTTASSISVNIWVTGAEQ